MLGPEISDDFSCLLTLLIPFSDGRDIIPKITSDTVVSQSDYEKAGVGLLATGMMAIEDFNMRTSSIVPGLDRYADCEVEFQSVPIVFDTAKDPSRISSNRDEWLDDESCAIIGPIGNEVALAAGTILEGSKVPLLSYGSLAPSLTSNPNVFLGTVDWNDTVFKLCEYISAQNWESLGVLLTPGSQLDSGDFLQTWTKTRCPPTQLSIVSDRTRDNFEERLSRLKEKSIKTIVIALERDDNLSVLAEVAEELEMLSTDYTWILMSSFLLPENIMNLSDLADGPVGSMLARSRIFHVLDGLEPVSRRPDLNLNPKETTAEVFREEWQERGDSSLLSEIRMILNTTEWAMGNETVLDDDFFQQNSPPYRAGFLYDAIMSVGISACEQISISDAEHEGPSGQYRFQNKSLDASGLEYGVFIVQLGERGYDALLNHVTVDGVWSFLSEQGGMPGWAFALTLSFGTLALCFALGCFSFFAYFRKNRIVSVGQPEFLCVVCVGAALIATGCLLYAFDESNGWSNSALDAKCVAIEWCEHLGILIVFMALFSKLWRVEKVTQMRRRQRIEVRHVLMPFVASLVLAILVLFLYTFLNPPKWKASDQDVGFGQCDDNAWERVALAGLLAVALCITLWEAYKTKHLPEDISDSRRVWHTLLGHAAVLLLHFGSGLVAFLVDGEVLKHFSSVLVLFCWSVVSVALLSIPKMYLMYNFKSTGELPASLQRGRTRVTGLNTTGGQSASAIHFTVNNDRPPISSIGQSTLSGTRGSSVSESTKILPGMQSFRSLTSHQARSNRSLQQSPRK